MQRLKSCKMLDWQLIIPASPRAQANAAAVVETRECGATSTRKRLLVGRMSIPAVDPCRCRPLKTGSMVRAPSSVGEELIDGVLMVLQYLYLLLSWSHAP